MSMLSTMVKLMTEISDAKRLNTLAVIDRHHSFTETAERNRRARQTWLEQIRDCAEYGMVAVITWSRDCDCCEGTSRSLVPADVVEVDQFCDRQLDWAEGPMTFHVQKPSEPFQSYSRDRVLEAYENGSSYRV